MAFLSHFSSSAKERTRFPQKYRCARLSGCRGLPDRDFYYLVGLRIGNGESAVQHSLWADTIEDEGKMWSEFLGILGTIEKPVLIHYGSYEKTFLNNMCERHGKPPEGSVVARVLGAGVNLLTHLFAQIYFPGFSNGLKDTAGTLGFNWSEVGSPGLKAIAWRCQWEELRDSMLKERLTTYNAQDCEALSLVADTVRHPCPPTRSGRDACWITSPRCPEPALPQPEAPSRTARKIASTFSIGVLPWILWMASKTNPPPSLKMPMRSRASR
jgi:hypothetical protein